jgi:ribonuclease HII
VVLDPDYRIEGLADSKKLSEKTRTKLEILIKTHSMAWAVASASVDEIDQLNILQASLLAMKRAVESMKFTPDQVLVDGNHRPNLNFPVQAIIRGDSLIPEISAASILAKTARDAEMMRLHQDFPRYGFDRHKGYPTAAHIIALQEHGISSEHRRSFAPVKKLIMQCEP